MHSETTDLACGRLIASTEFTVMRIAVSGDACKHGLAIGIAKGPQLKKTLDPILALGIELPRGGRGGLLRAVHTQLRAAIRDGRLQPGLQLPPTRTLSRALGVSRNTAVGAYDLLLSEGYLRARRGAGTYVSQARATLERRATRAPSSKPPELSEFWRNPPPLFPGMRRAAAPARYNFSIGEPDVSQFPFAMWRRLVARAARASSKDVMPCEPQGRAELRAAIAQHVSFTRAIACSADDIIVTGGSQQAFDLLARVLVTPKRSVVALEEAHYPPLRQVFRAAGARIVTAPVDPEGIVVDRISPQARIVCVMPSHQLPLGAAMSFERRAALLRFARRYRASIIEDDYDGEYRFGQRPLDALQTLDGDERVFYVGTFSKIMFPTVRVGYIIAPAWARAALIAAKQLTDRHTTVLMQDALTAFLTEGHLVRHVRKMTRVYAGRRATLLAALGRHCARQLEPLPSEAGLHITARLLVPVAASAVLAAAAEAGIKVQAVSEFSIGKAPLNGLGFGYGGIADDDIDPGVRLLANVIARACKPR
jgi:GntR family transcriptional regulator / MocR family aminotransferase